MGGDGGMGWGAGCRLYAIASALVLNVDSWISLTYSGAIERKQVAEYVGGEGGRKGGGAIVINAADAAFCNASGQCSHLQKSPPNSLQIPNRPSESLLNLPATSSSVSPCFLTITSSSLLKLLRLIQHYYPLSPLF